MQELTAEAAILIRATRNAFRPTCSDRERVLWSLRRVLGEGVHLGQSDGIAHGDSRTAASLCGAELSTSR